MYKYRIEELPERLRNEINKFLRQHSGSPAAQSRVRLGCTEAGWYVFLHPSNPIDIRLSGATPVEALQRFNDLIQQSR
jgi:hypothetical protein